MRMISCLPMSVVSMMFVDSLLPQPGEGFVEDIVLVAVPGRDRSIVARETHGGWISLADLECSKMSVQLCP